MSREAKCPIGSRWAPNRNPKRVFVIIDKKPFGKLFLQEEGRAYFVDMYQRDLLRQNTRLLDQS